MKRISIGKLAFAAALVLSSIASAYAQPSQPQPPPPPDPAELAKIRASIEASPDDLKLHEEYLKASQFTKWNAPDDPEFIKQYEDWMVKFPKSATVAYSLGHAYARKESPKAKPYLMKALEIDPKYDKAYYELWIDAERWGDFKAARGYLQKAKEIDPKNADYAFYFANSFDENPKEYAKQSLAVAKEFPGTNRGAQALYWLAVRSQNGDDKVKYWEQQKKEFPADKFSWTASGMSGYFNFLLEKDADKAVALAQEMIAQTGSNERSKSTWEANLKTAKSVAEVNSLLKQGKAAEALAIAEKIPTPRFGGNHILFLKGKVLDAAGKTQDAYNSLLATYARTPSPEINDQLMGYAKKIGKNVATVESEVWFIRDTASKKVPDFTMYNYFTKQNTSLADLKGKVVLYTYWFPGCGPCRGEFPHFENAIKKFKNRSDFAYIGINIVEYQDDYVLPFMKQSGYSFTPLRDNDKWTKGPMDNRNAAPMNFLVDKDGNIIFFRFRTDGDNEDELEMMIGQMLNRKKDAQP